MAVPISAQEHQKEYIARVINKLRKEGINPDYFKESDFIRWYVCLVPISKVVEVAKDELGTLEF